MLDKLKRNNGFTIAEILIGMLIGTIVMGAIYSTYVIQSKSSVVQDQVSEMQQNLRAALYMMGKEIRMAGFNPVDAADPNLGITTPSTNSITFAADFDGNGTLDGDETITYSIPAGTTDLCRNDGGGDVVLAENIEDLGFAYAFDDNDNDSVLETTTVNQNIIWAIDNNGDNQLDVNLDTNDDGDITIADVVGGAVFAGSPVALADIRAVKIWVLARTGRQDDNFSNRNTYVVANQRITPNDSFRRRLLTTTVRCMNMGL